jgi:hypothetical protein
MQAGCLGRANDLEILAADLLVTTGCDHSRLLVLYVNWAPATGPPAVRQRRGGRRRGADRAHPEGETPQLGAAGRDSHQDTETQTSTFLRTLAEPCAPAGPLWGYLRRV